MLEAIGSCFDGVHPAALATQTPDGMPNLSYLSHVVQVDAAHIAISDQFFAKAARNLRDNPRATLLLVEPATGAHYHLALIWLRSLDQGPLFEHVAGRLAASSAQRGFRDLMRLRAIELFRVERILPVGPDAADSDARIGAALPPPALPDLAEAMRRMAALADPIAIADVLLDSVRDLFGHGHAMVLCHDARRKMATAVAAIGYEVPGIGAEVAYGAGLIGSAIELKRSMRINDLSQMRREGAGVRDAARLHTARAGEVALPGLPSALSQIAVPGIVRDAVVLALFVESRDQMAFDKAMSAALEMLVQQAAALLVLAAPSEQSEDHAVAAMAPACERSGLIAVAHHAFDHSIFVDGAYVIKGLAGRVLAHMLVCHLVSGQLDFSNRELRLALAGVLPDFKDNLETRLLLLRRRLDEMALPLRLLHVGRGRVRLELAGRVELSEKA